jgi:hypothetical protein
MNEPPPSKFIIFTTSAKSAYCTAVRDALLISLILGEL